MRNLFTFSDIQAALAEVYTEKPFKSGAPSRLESMAELLAVLGDPHTRLKVLHVAGTSGKTSTSYYAAALLHNAGFKVGLAVSPHVIQMNDRVQINNVPLPEDLMCTEMQEFLNILKGAELHVSYFELMMAFALWEFDRQQVDYAVIEVFVGGTLDPTNVIQSPDKVCIITDIGLDHTHVLGNTLPEIAAQKAGIIGWHNVVFCFQQTPEIMRVFHSRCKQQQASLNVLGESEVHEESKDLPLFQQRNFSLACAAVEFVCKRAGATLNRRAREQTLATTFIPGRMETVVVDGKTIVVDGAHNGQKVLALAKSVHAKYPTQKIAALVAFSDDIMAEQRISGSLAALKPFASRLLITEFSGDQHGPRRGVAPERVADLARKAGFNELQIFTVPEEAYRELLKTPETLGLVVGSFYLLNHIRPLLYKRQ